MRSADGRRCIACPLRKRFFGGSSRCQNWGRWGNDDERGTLNLITAQVCSRGAGSYTKASASRTAVSFRLTSRVRYSGSWFTRGKVLATNTMSRCS